jgi:hypothetical protein
MKRFYLKGQVWEVGKNDLELKYIECEEKDFDSKIMVSSAFELLPEGHKKKPIAIKRTRKLKSK